MNNIWFDLNAFMNEITTLEKAEDLRKISLSGDFRGIAYTERSFIGAKNHLAKLYWKSTYVTNAFTETLMAKFMKKGNPGALTPSDF